MPTVASIVETVQNQSNVGSGNDTIVLNYLNYVYKEVYRMTAKEYPTLLLTTESVTTASGSATLTSAPLYIYSAYSDLTKAMLSETSLPELEQEYPALDGTGNPNQYYLTGTSTFNAYPIANGDVRVRYVSMPAELELTSLAADIMIPEMFHDVLLWGSLVYMAYDERDKGVSMEIGISDQKYNKALSEYRTWLFESQPREPIRTESILA